MQSSDSKKSQRIPFNPHFSACQTAFEQQNNLRQQSQQLRGGTTGTSSSHHSQQASISSSQGELPMVVKSNENLPRPSKTEPIYQEIPEVAGGAGNNHRSQHSWSGSGRNNVTAVMQSIPPDTSPGTRHKRTFSGGDLLSVKRPTTAGNSSGGGAMNNGLMGSSFDRLKWQTASVRHQHHVGGIETNHHNDQEESIPGSPSFYTKHPEASTMMQADSISLRSQQYGGDHQHTNNHHLRSQHFFQEHLTNLETMPGSGGGHNRVMNWMQHLDSGPHPPNMPTPNIGYRPPPTSLPPSQSVHSQLNRPLPTPTETRNFKDHLYEDLEQAARNFNRASTMKPKSASSLPRMRSLTVSTNQISNSSLPYVTRELPSSKPGSTMYATDV